MSYFNIHFALPPCSSGFPKDDFPSSSFLFKLHPLLCSRLLSACLPVSLSLCVLLVLFVIKAEVLLYSQDSSFIYKLNPLLCCLFVCLCVSLALFLIKTGVLLCSQVSPSFSSSILYCVCLSVCPLLLCLSGSVFHH